MKKLTKKLHKFYIKKATQKIKNDFEEYAIIVEEKGWSIHPQIESEIDDPEHIYYVAQKMWTKDGYIETPTKFINSLKRENTLFNKIIKIK